MIKASLFFIKLLIEHLKHSMSRKVRVKNCFAIMDNARMDKTDKIIKLVKENKLILFTFPPYSSRLNKIEHKFKLQKKGFLFKKSKYNRI